MRYLSTVKTFEMGEVIYSVGPDSDGDIFVTIMDYHNHKHTLVLWYRLSGDPENGFALHPVAQSYPDTGFTTTPDSEYHRNAYSALLSYLLLTRTGEPS